MDTQLGITSVSLPVALVGQILEDWLNTHWSRIPLHVAEVDLLDAYDRVDGVVHVSVTLAAVPAAAGPAGPAPVAAVSAPAEVAARRNRHSVPAAVRVLAELAGEEVQAAPAARKSGTRKGKSCGPDDEAAIGRLHADGLSIGAISQRTGWSPITVWRALARVQAAG